jgi:hypothetical protein
MRGTAIALSIGVDEGSQTALVMFVILDKDWNQH